MSFHKSNYQRVRRIRPAPTKSVQSRICAAHQHAKQIYAREVTFVLDGLALARRSALRDSPGDEDDELPGGVALEVAEVADVRGVGQHQRLRARPAAGRGGTRAGGRRLQYQERRNLHRRTARSTPLTIRWLYRERWMDGDRTRPKRKRSTLDAFLDCSLDSVGVEPH
jgi:hypothetical protein